MEAQTLLLDGSNHMVGHLNMSGNEIINSGNIIMNNKLVKQLGNPTGDQDAVNLLTLNNTKQELKTTIDNKLNKNTDIDMTSHKIFGLENNPDHKFDDEYSIIIKDVNSVVNKEYINTKCLKISADETYFDLKGQLIKNSEPFNPSSYDDQSLVPEKYIDDTKAEKSDVLLLDGTKKMLGNLDMNSKHINNVFQLHLQVFKLLIKLILI